MAEDPFKLDDLIARAARATQRTGRQKRYASAMGISQSRASRHMSGDDPYSPTVRLLAHVERLASGDGTSAIPIIVEAWATAMAALSDLDDAALQARLREYMRREVERQADLALAQLEEFELGARYGSESVDRAKIALSEVTIEVAVIRRILRERAEREKGR